MRCVEVRAGRPYEVFIGRGLMDAAGGMIVEALGGTRMAAILTDDTVDALYSARVEQALSEYPGTLLIVSHDRYLINQLADRVYQMTADGLIESIGGYDDLLATRAKRAASAGTSAGGCTS